MIQTINTDDTLDSGRVKINSNFLEPRFGVYNYDNSIAPYSVNASTWTLVQNNGLGANTYLTGALSGVTIFNTTTNQFDYSGLELYDTVDIRFDSNITTTANNQTVQVRLLLSVGTLNIPLTFINSNYKTIGTFPLFGFIQNHLFTDAVRLQPAQFEIWSDSNLTLDVNGWAVKAIKRINEL